MNRAVAQRARPAGEAPWLAMLTWSALWVGFAAYRLAVGLDVGEILRAVERAGAEGPSVWMGGVWLHLSWLHLGVNVACVATCGAAVRRARLQAPLAAAALLGAGAGLGAVALQGRVAVGGSGAAVAVAACTAVYAWRARANDAESALKASRVAVAWCALWVLSSSASGTNAWSHVVGASAGVVVALAAPCLQRWAVERAAHALGLLWALVAGLWIACAHCGG